MKNLKISSLIALLSLTGFISYAQLSTGTDGFFVTSGTTISIDSLTMIPIVDLSLTNTDFTRSNLPIITSNGSSISRVYDLSQPLSVTGVIGLYYLDTELNGNTAADLAFVHQLASDSSFVTSSTSSQDLPSRYITQFMTGTPLLKVTAVNSDVVLPVVLSSYTAKAEGSLAKIEWSITAEHNSDHYEIEHSADGITFITIATIKSTNSAVQHTYDAYDNNPVKGTNYYRLVQYDINGIKKYFDIKVLVFNGTNQVLVVAYPNPSKNTLSFKLQNYTGQKINVSLYDMHGLLIHAEEIQTRPEQVIYPVNLRSTLSSGDYILNIMDAQGLSKNVKVTVL